MYFIPCLNSIITIIVVIIMIFKRGIKYLDKALRPKSKDIIHYSLNVPFVHISLRNMNFREFSALNSYICRFKIHYFIARLS